MANKHGEQRHIRLAHFLINGCTTLARALVGKDVEFSKPREHEPVDKPWSLDSFLHKNMKILCKTCNPKQQDILFPGHQDKSDIEQWDISLLCLVITNCTNNETVRGDIKQLKKIRNIIFHAGNTDISQEVYDRNVEILDCIVERCCKFIDEPNFSLTMKELLENLKRGNVIVTDKDFEAICQWYESDPLVMLNSKVDKFSDDQQLLMNKVDEILALTKQSGLKGIVLPDTNVELIVKNCDSAKEKVISEYLVKLLKCRMADDIPDVPEADKQKVFDLVREAMAELLTGGRELVDIYQACVNLTIRCATFASLRDLWIDCMTGKLTRAFKPLEIYVRQLTGCPDITIEVEITQFEFYRCFEATVMQIPKAIQAGNDDVFGEQADLFTEIASACIDDIDTDSSRHSPDEGAVTRTEGDGTRVIIRMQPTSFNQVEHLWRAWQSDRFTDILKRLSQVIQETYGFSDLSIIAKAESTSPYDDIFRNKKRRLSENEGYCIDKETIKGETPPDLRMTQRLIEKPEHIRMVYKKVSSLVPEEFPSLARMGKLDDETLRIYVNALETGIEKVRHIRLMVVGMYGVGKSCLVRKLCNETIDDVETTVGVDVLMDACEVDDKGVWISKKTSEGKQKGYDKRLNKLMSETEVERPVYEGQLTLSGPEIDSRPTAHSPMEGVSQSPRIPNIKVDTAKKVLHSFAADKKPGNDEYVNNIANYHKVGHDLLEMRKTSVSIWDFAGQSVYYSTHHFFLSSRSIYLLVMNLSKKLDDKVSENKSGKYSDKSAQDTENLLLDGCMPEGFTCRDALRFWINSIYTYTKGETKGCNNEGKPYIPKIVLVGTFKDQLVGTEKKKEMIKDEYFRDALEPFMGTPIYELIHGEKFLVSCTKDTQDVFEKIKASISDIAMEQPFWDEPVPAKWIPLERSTDLAKVEGDKYMRLQDLIEKDATTEFPLKDKANIQLFLAFQHFLGNLLYYNVKGLSETIILNPQWLIDGFKLFVTHQPSTNNQKMEKAWYEYQRQAKLTPELINHIIEQNDQNNENNFKKYREELIKFLQHLDVMAKPVTYSTDETSQDQDTDFFIVPCMLKKLTTDEAEELRSYFQPKLEDAKTTPVLCFVFRNRFVPPAVFHRLLATCIREFETATRFCKKKTHYLLYNGMGVFKLDRKRTLIIWYAEFVIFMRIAIYPAKEKLCLKECKAVKDEVSKMLTRILHLDKQKRPENASLQEDIGLFNEYILCEYKLEQSVEVLFKDADMNGLLAVDDLKEKGSLMCECKEQHHGVTKEDALKYWYLPPAESNDLEAWFEEVEKEKGNLENGEPNDMELAEIAEFIGDEYWKLGLLLGLTNSYLQRNRQENQFTVQTRITNMLIEWRKSPGNRTYNELRNKIRDAKGKH